MLPIFNCIPFSKVFRRFWPLSPEALHELDRASPDSICAVDCDVAILFVCLFDLILYVPSTIFQLYRDGSSWVDPVLSWDKCVLLKDHNAVTPVRLKPAAFLSRVKHSTTEPLHSLRYTVICV